MRSAALPPSEWSVRFPRLGDGIAGAEPSGMQQPVMVRIEEAWRLGMVGDGLEDGLLAVYVPFDSRPRATDPVRLAPAPYRDRRAAAAHAPA